MQTITHPQHTRSWGAPLGWDQTKVHCGALSTFEDTVAYQTVLKSCWVPEGDEGALILAGVPVELGVWSTVHPPVSMALRTQGFELTDVQLVRAAQKLRDLAQNFGFSLEIVDGQIMVGKR